MDDLVQWLRAQLDEDERIARAAEGDPVFDGTGIVIERNRARGFPDRVAGLISPVATHIARHDPARVLRDIDAKRRLMKQIFMYEAKIDGEWGCCHGADEIEAGMCEETSPNEIEALRLLALPYSDREGYRAEWRP